MKTTYVYDEVKKTMVEQSNRNTSGTGIVVMNRTCSDGSQLDKPMSSSYIAHIKSRNSHSVKRMKPNMGAYGA